MTFEEKCEKKLTKVLATSPVVVHGVPSGALKAIVRELVILEMKCEELRAVSDRSGPLGLCIFMNWSDDIKVAMEK